MRSGHAHKVVEWSGDAAGVILSGSFSGMKVNWPIVGAAPIRERQPASAGCVETLYACVQLADASQTKIFGLLALLDYGLGTAAGMNGGKSYEAIGRIFDPFGNLLVLQKASGLVLPIPAKQNSLCDACNVHCGKRLIDACPTLYRRPVEWGDQVGPVRFIICRCPRARICRKIWRVTVAVAVYDVHNIVKLYHTTAKSRRCLLDFIRRKVGGFVSVPSTIVLEGHVLADVL